MKRISIRLNKKQVELLEKISIKRHADSKVIATDLFVIALIEEEEKLNRFYPSIEVTMKTPNVDPCHASR